MSNGDDGDDGDGGDDGRELRASHAWRDLADEDPPDRGLAELMAAAQRQAERMATAAQPPWWRRMVSGMMRPPVLALASVAVLLGGVFAVTSVRRGVSPEPTAVEAPATPTEQAIPSPTPGAATGSAAASEPAPEATGGAAPPPLAPAPAKPVVREAPAPHATISRRSGLADDQRVPVAPKAAQDVAPETSAPPPAPPPAPPAKDSLDSDGAAPAVGGAPATRGPQKKQVAPDPEPGTPQDVLDAQLRSECRAAAARGDCESARRIAARIAQANPAYFRAHVASDVAISKCFPAPPSPAQAP